MQESSDEKLLPQSLRQTIREMPLLSDSPRWISASEFVALEDIFTRISRRKPQPDGWTKDRMLQGFEKGDDNDKEQ